MFLSITKKLQAFLLL